MTVQPDGNLTPKPRYKGENMWSFGVLLVLVFGLGVLWDLFHGSVPGTIAVGGVFVGALLLVRGKVVQRKRIPDLDLMKADAKRAAKNAARSETPPPSNYQRPASTARDLAARTAPTHLDQDTSLGHLRDGNWVPPRPAGRPVTPWTTSGRLEVVGEAYRQDAFRRLLGRKAGFASEAGAEIDAPALLVPDPQNPYGEGTAVAVYIRGEHVGYLAQEDADLWFPTLASLRARNEVLQVPARTWAAARGGRVAARTTLTVPSPDGIYPASALPDAPHVVLPEGRAIQVTKEDEHMDVLTPYVLPQAGAENPIAVTLRSINEIRARSAYEAVQVEIDGQRAGVLTKGQSEKLLPLVKHVERRGLVPVAHAIVRGSTLKADVIIRCATAETISEGWLAALGPETTPANVDATPEPPARPDFDWDDEDVPAGATKPDRERDDPGEESQVGPEEE